MDLVSSLKLKDFEYERKLGYDGQIKRPQMLYFLGIISRPNGNNGKTRKQPGDTVFCHGNTKGLVSGRGQHQNSQ